MLPDDETDYDADHELQTALTLAAAPSGEAMEPTVIRWKDSDSRAPCIVLKDRERGGLSAFVGVDATHPWHGLSARKIDAALTKHRPPGGVTHGRSGRGGHGALEALAQPKGANRWWIGFDAERGMTVEEVLAQTRAFAWAIDRVQWFGPGDGR